VIGIQKQGWSSTILAIYGQNKVISRLDKILESYDTGACWSDSN